MVWLRVASEHTPPEMGAFEEARISKTAFKTFSSAMYRFIVSKLYNR